MKGLLLLALMLLICCSASWSESPYEIYWIDGGQQLGFNVVNGGYVTRILEPREVSSNQGFISVYACPKNSCAYYYIDKKRDHAFAGAKEFVFGPYEKSTFKELQEDLSLPELEL